MCSNCISIDIMTVAAIFLGVVGLYSYPPSCCNNKNSQYNKTTKHTPDSLWNPDSFYDRVKNNTRELPASIAKSEATPEAIRINARNNIKEKAKKQIGRTHIDELNIGDHVRV